MGGLVHVRGLGKIVAAQRHIGALAGGAFRGAFRRFIDRRGLAVVAFQQRIFFQLGFAIFGQFDIGQLQQLDRLLQLRRHDQRLALPQLQSWTDPRHDAL